MLENDNKTLFEDISGRECPICLEGFDQNNQETTLRCKHAFHSECLVKCLLFQYKTQNGRFRCPMCRTGICCNTKRELLYDNYMQSRRNYKHAKKQANGARSKLMNWNIKHQILKYFKKYTAKEVYDILVRDEELTYEMHKLEAIARQERQRYYAMKAIYEKPCCARCVARYYYY